MNDYKSAEEQNHNRTSVKLPIRSNIPDEWSMRLLIASTIRRKPNQIREAMSHVANVMSIRLITADMSRIR